MTYKLVKAGDKMSLYDKANETANYIKSKIKNIPDTAIVLGSGLGMFANEIEKELVLDYKDIPNFPISTVPGHNGKLIFGKIGEKKIIAMQFVALNQLEIKRFIYRKSL